MTIIAVDVGGTNALFGIAETGKGSLTGIKNLICDDFPMWLATDTLVGLDGARKALANPNLASRVIAKTCSYMPDPVTEVHRSQRQHDHDD